MQDHFAHDAGFSKHADKTYFALELEKVTHPLALDANLMPLSGGGWRGRRGGAVVDPIKQTASNALAALWAGGIRIVILTSDNRTMAEAVALRLGIAKVEVDAQRLRAVRL